MNFRLLASVTDKVELLRREYWDQFQLALLKNGFHIIYFNRFIRTYMITRNTCIAEHREARGVGGGGGAHKRWKDRRQMKQIM